MNVSSSQCNKMSALLRKTKNSGLNLKIKTLDDPYQENAYLDINVTVLIACKYTCFERAVCPLFLPLSTLDT